MRTNTRVEFGLFDVTARGDSTPSSAAAQPFCDLQTDLLLEERPPQTKYGTLEARQFLMDGSFELFPEEPAGSFWGLWSRQQSGADGRFAEPPILELSFNEDHSSSGVTLHFYEPTGDWASDVLIQWYGPFGELLTSARCAPDAVDYYCSCKVTGYRSMKLTFLATSRPGRYLKLSGLDYGVALTFAGDQVRQAKVLEEVDLLSNEVRINTLDLTLFNKDGAFSILNPAGVFDVLQHKQKFTVWEDVRADAKAVEKVSHNMGTFYLSEWENTSDTLASFSAVDAVGLLDSAPHRGGIYDTTAGTLVADILEGYDYELAPSLAERPVRGWLPIGTRRSALQQLAFALGAVVDCSRSDKIKIYPPPTRPSSLITVQRKFMGSKVSLKPLITGVTVTAHQYTLGTVTEELFKDELAAGTHEIQLKQPACCLEVTGAQMVEWDNNYAIVKVEKPGEVVITGRKYTETQTSIRQAARDIPANAKANELTVDSATLVDPAAAPAVAARVLDYYARRYEQTFDMLAGEEVLADMLVVQSFGGEMVRGCLESMEFDLSGGYRASVKVVGQRINTAATAYAGEIRAGERSVI